ncbi:MAG TPA: hypothetical protein VLE99_06685 [Candidatus Saccharimonadales bacterium]|nr:hypothetical protein [Candidatus Saccharimonadales bacterium]
MGAGSRAANEEYAVVAFAEHCDLRTPARRWPPRFVLMPRLVGYRTQATNRMIAAVAGYGALRLRVTEERPLPDTRLTALILDPCRLVNALRLHLWNAAVRNGTEVFDVPEPYGITDPYMLRGPLKEPEDRGADSFVFSELAVIGRPHPTERLVQYTHIPLEADACTGCA